MRATTTLNLAVGSVVIAGLVACGGSAPPPDQPETTAAAPVAPAPAPAEAPPAERAESAEEGGSSTADVDVPPEGSSVQRIMQAHFKDAMLIREAVISGKSENASEPATVLAELEDLSKLPKGWDTYVQRMQVTAKRITNSTVPAETAAAAADLGVSCGQCHQAHGGPKPSAEPMPAAGNTFKERMKYHVWATERLWEGLAVPSAEAWNAGAKALASDPFPKQAVHDAGVDARAAASDFVKLSAKAASKKTIEERAALYAEMLVTCGACHHAMKNKE